MANEIFIGNVKGQDGADGKSAYQLAIEQEFSGTLEEWLQSLHGENGIDGVDGQDGADGKSAYQLAVEQGFIGTLEEWLQSLHGENGKDGENFDPAVVEKVNTLENQFTELAEMLQTQLQLVNESLQTRLDGVL